MCRPTNFDVKYSINPWMENQIGKVNNLLALNQWHVLFEALSKNNIVNLINSVVDTPDLVFTANAGFIHGKVAILSKFANPERQPEEAVFGAWFESKGYTVVQPVLNYEGEGDHLKDSKGRHWVGSGFRTDRNVGPELAKILGTEVNMLEMVDPRWYHLDTCFCPLPFGQLLWYPPAFNTLSQITIRKAFQYNIEISLADALLFTCNCISMGSNLFLPKNNYASFALENLGYVVSEFELGEFMKAGGAAKCLVLHME